MKNKIGIIGNGFVGSAIVNAFALKYEIKIYDIDSTKRTHDLVEVVNNSDFIFLCLPTPMKCFLGGPIDLSVYLKSLEEINKVFVNKNQVFIIKSTVVPGTTESLAEKYPHFNFVFNPEFLTERSANLDFINASRIVLGGPKTLTNRVEEMYRVRFPYKRVIKSDYKTAEMIKYMCNCFFSTKISFMNEMKQIVNKIDGDWDTVMEGFISDGRIGNSHLEVPGHDGHLGFGGKCFPKDLNALIHFSENVGVRPTILKAAWEKNLEVRKVLDWNEIAGAVSKAEK
jgi:nucleotide sugar dehydrogenase